MENEKKEVEKSNLGKLQEQIARLEVALNDLREKSHAKLEDLKKKLEDYKVKNQELINKIKSIKPIESFKSLIEKVKAKFRRAPYDPEQCIFCVSMGNYEEYIRGYEVGTVDGFVHIIKAETLDFSTGKAIVMQQLGEVYVNQESIIMCYSA